MWKRLAIAKGAMQLHAQCSIELAIHCRQLASVQTGATHGMTQFTESPRNCNMQQWSRTKAITSTRTLVDWCRMMTSPKRGGCIKLNSNLRLHHKKIVHISIYLCAETSEDGQITVRAR